MSQGTHKDNPLQQQGTPMYSFEPNIHCDFSINNQLESFPYYLPPQYSLPSTLIGETAKFFSTQESDDSVLAMDEEEDILLEAINGLEDNIDDYIMTKRKRTDDNKQSSTDILEPCSKSAKMSIAVKPQHSVIHTHRNKFTGLVNKNKAAFKPVVRVPHMPSQDIRRSYATMWGNSFNLYDPKLLLNFLIKHVRGDSTLVKAFPQGGSDLLSFPSHIQLHGKKDLLLYWLGVLLLSPDQVILHDHIRIEPRKDSSQGSKITCRLQVRGTRPYSLSLAQLIDLVNNHVNGKLETQGKSVYDLTDEEYMDVLLQLDPYQCIGDIEKEVGSMLVQAETPGPLNVVGAFTFLLDSNKMIECMDYSIAPDTQLHRGYFDEMEEVQNNS